jgi:hypothetical protein
MHAREPDVQSKYQDSTLLRANASILFCNPAYNKDCAGPWYRRNPHVTALWY